MPMESSELIWLDEHHEVSMLELVELSGLTAQDLQHLVEIGALIPNNLAASDLVPNDLVPSKPSVDDLTISELRFSSHTLVSIRTLSRLKSDFELEQHALGLMLVFLERIRHLELKLNSIEGKK